MGRSWDRDGTPSGPTAPSRHAAWNGREQAAGSQELRLRGGAAGASRGGRGASVSEGSSPNSSLSFVTRQRVTVPNLTKAHPRRSASLRAQRALPALASTPGPARGAGTESAKDGGQEKTSRIFSFFEGRLAINQTHALVVTVQVKLCPPKDV